MPAKIGDKVKIEYTGSLDDGTVFDASEKHGEPMQFELGAGQVIKGFDTAVEGMEEGQEKQVRLEPVDAYGDRNPALLKEFPREQLPADKEIKPGMMLMVGLANGMQFPAVIAAVDEKNVTIDLNHPLAGKALTFKIKLVEIVVA